MAYDEALEFGLYESWDFEVRLYDPAGVAIPPASVATAKVVFAVIGGDEVLEVEAAAVATVGAGDAAYTRALFQIEPPDRLDGDDALLFARRCYEKRAWVELIDGTVHDQNGGFLTVT